MQQCPFCDYLSLERRGEYDVCRVCFWEDSRQNLDRLDEHLGPNHQTTRQALENFANFGPCDQPAQKSVLPVGRQENFERQPHVADAVYCSP
jgi:hypothetical protein